jgi:hypothetical protein
MDHAERQCCEQCRCALCLHTFCKYRKHPRPSRARRLDPAQAVCRSPSTRLSHSPIWFKLAKMRLTSLRSRLLREREARAGRPARRLSAGAKRRESGPSALAVRLRLASHDLHQGRRLLAENQFLRVPMIASLARSAPAHFPDGHTSR